MEEYIHTSSLVRLGTKTIIKPQAEKLHLGRVKGNSQDQITLVNVHQRKKEAKTAQHKFNNSIVKVNK